MVQLYYPEGLSASDILPRLGKRNVIVAGGLHHAIKGIFPRLLIVKRCIDWLVQISISVLVIWVSPSLMNNVATLTQSYAPSRTLWRRQGQLRLPK